MYFEDTASAAEAAAESAKNAIAAAQAAAYLARRDSNQFMQPSSFDEIPNTSHNNPRPGALSGNSTDLFPSHDHQSEAPGKMHYESQSFHRSNHVVEDGKVSRRQSYNAPPSAAHSDIKFDESDCDEEIEMEEPPPPPVRPPPPVPSLDKQGSVHHVHPKLPDYDDLAARFEALKRRKS